MNPMRAATGSRGQAKSPVNDQQNQPLGQQGCHRKDGEAAQGQGDDQLTGGGARARHGGAATAWLDPALLTICQRWRGWSTGPGLGRRTGARAFRAGRDGPAAHRQGGASAACAPAPQAPMEVLGTSAKRQTSWSLRPGDQLVGATWSRSDDHGASGNGQRPDVDRLVPVAHGQALRVPLRVPRRRRCWHRWNTYEGCGPSCPRSPRTRGAGRRPGGRGSAGPPASSGRGAGPGWFVRSRDPQQRPAARPGRGSMCRGWSPSVCPTRSPHTSTGRSWQLVGIGHRWWLYPHCSGGGHVLSGEVASASLLPGRA